MRTLVGFAVAVAVLVALADKLVGGRHPDIPQIRWEALRGQRPQAAEALARIRAQGPFPYPQDDTVFTNVQRVLPPRERDAYREYTVDTPGAPNRGARRLVTGGAPRRRPGDCDAVYYTDDHYATFFLVRGEPGASR